MLDLCTTESPLLEKNITNETVELDIRQHAWTEYLNWSEKNSKTFEGHRRMGLLLMTVRIYLDAPHCFTAAHLWFIEILCLWKHPRSLSITLLLTSLPCQENRSSWIHLHLWNIRFFVVGGGGFWVLFFFTHLEILLINQGPKGIFWIHKADTHQTYHRSSSHCLLNSMAVHLLKDTPQFSKKRHLGSSCSFVNIDIQSHYRCTRIPHSSAQAGSWLTQPDKMLQGVYDLKLSM